MILNILIYRFRASRSIRIAGQLLAWRSCFAAARLRMVAAHAKLPVATRRGVVVVASFRSGKEWVMWRLVRPVFPLLVGVAVVASGLLAQEEPPKPKEPAPKFRVGDTHIGQYRIPSSGIWWIHGDRRELKLTTDQQQKLAEIQRNYEKDTSPLMKSLSSGTPQDQDRKSVV
jgi:hypothetical protein